MKPLLPALKAPVAALATVLALTAPPAQAVNEEALGKVLGATVGLVILGIIADEALSDRDRDRPRPPPRPRPQAKPEPLPRWCARRSSVPGTAFVMGQRCLIQTYPDADRLPGACKVSAQYAGRPYGAYSVRCLRHRGFTVARAR